MLYSNRYINRTDIKYILLTFLYLFYFKIERVPIISLFDSTLVVGILLMIVFFFSNRYRKEMNNTICKRCVLRILASCMGIILLAILITSMHGQYEFSICKPLFHQLLFLIIGFAFYTYLKTQNKQQYIIEYMIVAYSIQTIIQYVAFLVPAFSDFTNIFKSDFVIELKKQYDGFRLNAISGGVSFSIAGAYGIITTIMIYKWKEIKLKNKTLFLILLLAGSLTAGRTALLMIGISVFLYVLFSLFARYKRSIIQIKQSTAYVFLLSPVILIGLYFVVQYIYKNLSDAFLARLSTVSYWLTKWKSEYFRSGNFSEYDFWSDNYQVLNQISSLFLGDGIYTNPDGSYYLHKDAGYVRMLAFGGGLWSLALFFHQFQLSSFKRKVRKESIVIVLLLAIGTLKCDCVGIDLQVILILILLYQYNTEDKGVIVT